MQKYKSNITTTSGAAIRNVPVTVFKEDDALATLFLDRHGAVPAPNPLTTEADGTFYFYAVNGRYSLRTTVNGVTITDPDVVLLADPDEMFEAGPIADAVARAEAAADRAESASDNEKVVNVGRVGNLLPVDLAAGNVFLATLTEPQCTVSIPRGVRTAFTLVVKQGSGANKLTWPSSVKWSYQAAPVLSYEQGAEDVIILTSYDGGLTWRGFFAGGGF
jgi:hypothetical protein